ncbi:MAG: hypothetical protein ACE5OR_09070 [bacterium]
MGSKRFLLFAAVLFLLPHMLQGQEDNSGQTFLSRSSMDRFGSRLSGGLSLLDPSRFSMSQSYSISFSSSGGKGTAVGLYMNTMKYQFSEPLSLTVHVGYLHQPFTKGSFGRTMSKGAFLSGFELMYRPSKNFFLKIEHGATPLGYYPYYRNRFWDVR